MNKVSVNTIMSMVLITREHMILKVNGFEYAVRWDNMNNQPFIEMPGTTRTVRGIVDVTNWLTNTEVQDFHVDTKRPNRDREVFGEIPGVEEVVTVTVERVGESKTLNVRVRQDGEDMNLMDDTTWEAPEDRKEVIESLEWLVELMKEPADK